MQSIDLNADLGEGGPYDAELMAVITRCNIACGGHAGDATSMRRTIDLALAHGVTIGAHPSYPDRDGFGRRKKFLQGAALYDALARQTEDLIAIATAAGTGVDHLKPHGALYNDAADSAELAATVVDVANEFNGMAIVGLPDSELAQVAEAAGVSFLAEAFIDRAYLVSGRLAARDQAGAVHESTAKMREQALDIVMRHSLKTLDNKTLSMHAATLCVHGDTQGAVAAAIAVRDALIENGVVLRAARR